MSREQAAFSFDLNESLYFRSGEEVGEMVSISLEPIISVHSPEEYVQLRGVIELKGEYRRGENGHADYVPIDDEDDHAVRHVEEVRETEEGELSFLHHFPIEISIPHDRVEDSHDIKVQVTTFDYDFPSNDRLNLLATIEIEGIVPEEQRSEAEFLTEEKDLPLPFFGAEDIGADALEELMGKLATFSDQLPQFDFDIIPEAEDIEPSAVRQNEQLEVLNDQYQDNSDLYGSLNKKEQEKTQAQYTKQPEQSLTPEPAPQAAERENQSNELNSSDETNVSHLDSSNDIEQNETCPLTQSADQKEELAPALELERTSETSDEQQLEEVYAASEQRLEEQAEHQQLNAAEPRAEDANPAELRKQDSAGIETNRNQDLNNEDLIQANDIQSEESDSEESRIQESSQKQIIHEENEHQEISEEEQEQVRPQAQVDVEAEEEKSLNASASVKDASTDDAERDELESKANTEEVSASDSDRIPSSQVEEPASEIQVEKEESEQKELPVNRRQRTETGIHAQKPDEEGADLGNLTDLFGRDQEDGFTQMRLYIVQERDTIESIADRYEIPVSRLLQHNRLDNDNLGAGQLIYIPVPREANA